MGLSLVFDVMDRENRMAAAELLQDHTRDIIRFQLYAILYLISFNAIIDLFILSPTRPTGPANKNIPVIRDLINKWTVNIKNNIVASL
jgi:hypothetical protein